MSQESHSESSDEHINTINKPWNSEKKRKKKGRITSLNKSTAVLVKQRQVNSEHLQSSIDLIQCMLSISFWSSTKDPEKKNLSEEVSVHLDLPLHSCSKDF